MPKKIMFRDAMKFFELALDKEVPPLSTEIDANLFYDSILESSDCLNAVYSLGDKSRKMTASYTCSITKQPYFLIIFHHAKYVKLLKKIN